MISHDDAERRRRRRAILRAHHPDRGGDPAELIRLLRALDAPPAADGSVVIRATPRGLRRVTAWVARRRAARRRPPRVR